MTIASSVRHPVRGIDHVFLLVGDLEAAAARWRRLGFTLSPKGRHSAHKGTANHTIMLADNYVELLGVVNPTPANEPQRAALARGEEGLAAVACRIDDARAAVAALEELGVPTTDVLDFERPLDLPGGGTGRAAFSIAAFGPDAVPHGHVFMCQHHTSATVWLPELTAHPNGARRFTGLVAAVENPLAVAGAYARLFAEGVVRELARGAEVRTGDAPITFLTPAGFGDAYPGVPCPPAAYGALGVEVADVEEARRVLVDGGVATHPTRRGFAVAPDEAAGAIVEFVAA
jgi:catechol 2,3-dioxygenase-like lactoylglutathione lyase family enzyme